MKKVVILIGSFCYNRGSEALVRGTIDIIKKYIPDSQIVLCSAEEEFGPHLNVDNVDKYVRRQSYYGKISINRLTANFYRKVLHRNDISDHIKYKYLLKECKDADLVIVSGGDNYDKSYNMFNLIHSVNKAIRNTSKAKMVMYDCSLDINEIDEDIKNDFKLFDAITARENDTYNAFLEKCPDNNVYYFPDPAFVMEAKEIKLPAKFKLNGTVGVNVSSMVTQKQYGSNVDDILISYENMIQWILSNTDNNVMLIPHVMKNLDLSVLKKLYARFTDDDRVFLIDNEELTAQELKYLISKCVFYVGARTHSTIAAYSTSVPTLVLGYSVKSIGIARDLFGTEKDYVVSTNNLSSTNMLTESFKKLYLKKDEIRRNLQNNIISNYISKACSAGILFKDLVE